MTILSRVPLHPLLFAAYSILFPYAANITDVLPLDGFVPLGRALITAGTLLAVLTLAFRDWCRAAIVATTGVIGFAFFGHLEPALTGLGLDERAQLMSWGIVLAGSAVVTARLRGALGSATLALNGSAIVLVLMTLLTIVPAEVGRAERPSQAIPGRAAPIAVATRVPGRDIYLIVLDTYGSNWSIENRYGIADNDLPAWLASQGFEVEPGARTNYRASDFFLASMLNMEFLDGLTKTVGPVSRDRTPAVSMIPQSAVGTFLRANGYRYIHLGSWWGPSQRDPGADEDLMVGQDTDFSALLHDTSIVPAIDRVLGRLSPDDPFRDRVRGIVDFQFNQLHRLAQVPGRKFVFAHILLPHAPYDYHADGSPIFAAEERSRPKSELYREQLAFTNARVRETVSTLLAGPDENDPIVVIMGDEGPLLCGNVDCMDSSARTLGIRFGILASFYLPGLPTDVFPPDTTPVNTFRVIFRDYFGADLPDLPDRSYTWPDNDHLYAFQDITDELPLPGSAVP